MALSFGEIEVETSRAFWDEEDEFDDDLQNAEVPDRLYKTMWMTDKNVLQYKFDVFIIVDGAFMKGVFQKCVIAKEGPIAQIVDMKSTSRLEENVNKSDVVGRMFLLDDKDKKAILCICESNLDITNSFFFTKEVFPLMMLSKEVMVLTSCNTSSYFHHHKTEMPISFLRRLQTDTYRSEPVCERLEQPNIVSGVSAQALSWCQVHQLPAILYVCYTEAGEIDSVSTKPITQLLSELNLANLRVNLTDLHNVSMVKRSSLLYM